METKPWLEHYDEGVPHTLQPYPDRTLLDAISDTARQRPDHPASLFKGASLSYGEWERLSDAFAAGLAAQGVKKGDRVALVLPNTPHFLIAELGAWKAGAIAVPMNPLYTEHELEQAFQECGHLDCGESSIGSLVALLESRPVHRLFSSVDSHQPIADRNSEFETDLADGIRHP